MIGNRSVPAHRELPVGSYLLNVFLGFLLAALVILIPRLFLEPYHKGFHCDDETIKLPYHKSTIPAYILIAGLFAIPAIVIVLTEMYRSSHLLALYSWKGYNINSVLANFFKYFGYHLLGVLLSLSAFQISHYAVGRLRPHFIEVCRPDIDLTKCTDHTYIEDYKCLNENQGLVNHARTSFFSGHASNAFTAATFLVIYLHARVPRKQSVILVRSILQLAVLTLGFYVGYTRVLDNQHHWTDVAVGYAVGALIGYLTAMKIANMEMPKEDLIEPDADFAFIDEDGEDNEEAPKYKTSVVRVEPTELRIFA